MDKFFNTIKPVIINAGTVAVIMILEGLTEAVKSISTEEMKVTPAGFKVAQNQTHLL